MADELIKNDCGSPVVSSALLAAAIGLLKIAKCPACDGSGAIGHEVGGCDPDGENDIRECVWEQCQWCDERTQLIAQYTANSAGERTLPAERKP